MRSEKYSDEVPGEALEILDCLIAIFYDRILALDKEGKLIIKPGDFMKMIELRHKLSPTVNEVQNFWKKIAQIRKNAIKNRINGDKKSKANGS